MAMPTTAAAITPPSTPRLGADADGDDRLAEGDDHDEAVAFGEVGGHELPPVGAEEERPGDVEGEGDEPQHALRGAVELRRHRPAGPRRPRCCRRARRAPSCRSVGSSRLATRNSAMWATRTTAYATANVRPRSPKASGMQSAITRKRGHGGEDRQPDARPPRGRGRS